MPRHMLPQVGTIVWYFADPTRRPQAAIVVKRVTETSFNLVRLNGETGVAAAALACPFLADSGLKLASGSYCTPTGIQDTVDGPTDVQTTTQHVSAAVIAAGGAGYAVNDTITLGNGVIVRVATISAGAILTVAITAAGSAVTPPGNPVAQVTTSGAGTGATFTLTWVNN